MSAGSSSADRRTPGKPDFCSHRVARSSLATRLKNICASLLDQDIAILVVFILIFFKLRKAHIADAVF